MRLAEMAGTRYWRKTVTTDVDLQMLVEHASELVVPYKVVEAPEGYPHDSYGKWVVDQEVVQPLAPPDRKIRVDQKQADDILDLVAKFWRKGYAFGDLLPCNMAYYKGGLRDLDLDAVQYVEDSGFDNLEELMGIAGRLVQIWLKN